MSDHTFTFYHPERAVTSKECKKCDMMCTDLAPLQYRNNPDYNLIP